ncbi:TetR/AcrR family transcriptional regulator [Rhodococcus sp. ARC_M6]|uniref:TetR/AcrR family transcriptional regulator n=1 Tax=Rhodococcus sp. ARC_M6 TaxID=2928852 RepID=UPI001FB354E9|nr:TetR/AcrR family transcriptional regulator [Rhodococcus sp. ARC_M6]MCJ0901953.1 TetR/AcrR family transcriptional regulator [Rhodococcus sp. ARC_M6]
MSTAMERPLRADAARNRQLIIDAARELFAEEGIDVTLDDVARRARVGVGTVYRRFSNKEELIDGVFQQNFADMAAATEASLANPDPWDALVTFAEFACGRMSVNRGLKDVLNGTDEGCEQVAGQRSIIEPAVEEIFKRAQDAGMLRPDAVPTDLFGLIFMVGAVTEFAQPVNPTVWRRYMSVMLDGLRAEGLHRDPLPLPPLSSDELHEAKQLLKTRKR